jgi:hypothetical protein
MTDKIEETKPEPPTKEEIKAMVAVYVKADDDVTTAKALHDKALEARSAAVKMIYAKCGKGKYSIKGEVVTLTSRKSKKTGKESFFFKGKNDEDVIGGDD